VEDPLALRGVHCPSARQSPSIFLQTMFGDGVFCSSHDRSLAIWRGGVCFVGGGLGFFFLLFWVLCFGCGGVFFFFFFCWFFFFWVVVWAFFFFFGFLFFFFCGVVLPCSLGGWFWFFFFWVLFVGLCCFLEQDGVRPASGRVGAEYGLSAKIVLSLPFNQQSPPSSPRFPYFWPLTCDPAWYHPFLRLSHKG